MNIKFNNRNIEPEYPSDEESLDKIEKRVEAWNEREKQNTPRH